MADLFAGRKREKEKVQKWRMPGWDFMAYTWGELLLCVILGLAGLVIALIQTLR